MNQKLGIEHVLAYIEGLVDGLSEKEHMSQFACSLLLTNCIKTRGLELHAVVGGGQMGGCCGEMVEWWWMLVGDGWLVGVGGGWVVGGCWWGMGGWWVVRSWGVWGLGWVLGGGREGLNG